MHWDLKRQVFYCFSLNFSLHPVDRVCVCVLTCISVCAREGAGGVMYVLLK